MFRGKIKKSEKLPRGTYLYIRVGDRFYSGEEVTIIEDTVIAPYRDEWSRWWSHKYSKSEANFYRTKRGKKIPSYQVEEDPKLREPNRAVTGHMPKLTDEFKDVKQFRRLNQAQAACDKLKSMYADLGIKVVIELHEGDK